jgi:starch-binding outer membrane protein, SusD/RagB family
MKKNQSYSKLFFSLLSVCSIIISCTDLEEKAIDGIVPSASGGSATSFLETAENGLRNFGNHSDMFALGEMSSDALVGPTRGGDWDDAGMWRQLHNHTWAPDNLQIRNTWNVLLSEVYNCNKVIESGTANQIIQARFLRAFYMYHVIDIFGQVPYREIGSNINDDPKVYTRTEATNFAITELEAILSNLPGRVPNDASIINKDAGHFLLAKFYLNKAVFTSADPASGTFTFAPADMAKVISNVDAISSSLAPNYWSNFEPDNNTSNEILFSSKSVGGTRDVQLRSRWYMGAHYKQTPGGWNGFATIAEYYDKFGANDQRKSYITPSIIQSMGNNVGFQVGQQYAPGGVDKLFLDSGAPVSFTKELKLITEGATLQTAGIRGIKYVPDPANFDKCENDYVLMRYADALLMKAEAQERTSAGSSQGILDQVRARSGESSIPTNLQAIYDERGRELWWEGWRRNDMIRFGNFLKPRSLKPGTSDKKYALFAIPSGALLNKNLKQNPGY